MFWIKRIIRDFFRRKKEGRIHVTLVVPAKVVKEMTELDKKLGFGLSWDEIVLGGIKEHMARCQGWVE